MNLLCKFLNSFSNIDIRPRHFGLAKYNKTDGNVVEKFWQLLNKLTVKDRVPNVSNIKTYFRKLSYLNPEFYALPDTMITGSKQLLIAFAYLLHTKTDTILKVIIDASVFADKYQILQCGPLESLQIHKPCNLTTHDYDNYRLWISARTRANKKAVRDIKKHIEQLTAKIKNILDINTEKLTFAEAVALSSKVYRDIFIDQTEEVSCVIENYLAWAEKQTMFWKWMLTVIERRPSSADVGADLSAKDSSTSRHVIARRDSAKRIILNDSSTCTHVTRCESCASQCVIRCHSRRLLARSDPSMTGRPCPSESGVVRCESSTSRRQVWFTTS